MELIVRNPSLPPRAGRARLEYFPAEVRKDGGYYRQQVPQPRREGELIHLPLMHQAEFHPLRRGEQFLYALPADQETAQVRAVYFGGQDEEPFLVRLDPRVMDVYRKSGEEDFYDALVPEAVRRVQRVTGREYKRQGDIFAVPVEWSWRDLAILAALQTREDRPLPGTLGAKRMSLFGTRHLFTGMHSQVDVGWVPRAEFFEGGIEAPDHADLALPGIYFLAQTAFLFDPKNAD